MSRELLQCRTVMAKIFAAKMRAALTSAQMRQVIRHPSNAPTCKTHDFVDSNELVWEAIVEWSGVPIVYSPNWDETINVVWDLARTHNWWINEEKPKMTIIRVSDNVGGEHHLSSTGWCEDCGGTCITIEHLYRQYRNQGLVSGAELECNRGDDEFCCRCAIAEEIKRWLPELIDSQPWPHVFETQWGHQIASVMERLMAEENMPGDGLIYFMWRGNRLDVMEYPSVPIMDGLGRKHYDPAKGLPK